MRGTDHIGKAGILISRSEGWGATIGSKRYRHLPLAYPLGGVILLFILYDLGFYTGVMAYADGRSNTTGGIDQAVLT